MAMNFYKEQAHARRQAKIMIVLFLLFAFFLTIILVKAIDWTYYFTFGKAHDMPDELPLPAFIAISILFFSSICTVSFYKLKELSKKG